MKQAATENVSNIITIRKMVQDEDGNKRYKIKNIYTDKNNNTLFEHVIYSESEELEEIVDDYV